MLPFVWGSLISISQLGCMYCLMANASVLIHTGQTCYFLFRSLPRNSQKNNPVRTSSTLLFLAFLGTLLFQRLLRLLFDVSFARSVFAFSHIATSFRLTLHCTVSCDKVRKFAALHEIQLTVCLSRDRIKPTSGLPIWRRSWHC